MIRFGSNNKIQLAMGIRIGIGIGLGHRRGAGGGEIAAPTGLILTVISDKQIDGEFTINGTGQDGYEVYLSTDNITFTLNQTLVGIVNIFSLTGLTHNTTYYVKVRAYKGTEYSPYSNTDSEQTIESWYLAGGVASANCKGAYQPIEAASLAASKVNLITPGVNNAGGGTDPTHDPALGWVFNGTSHYLKTGIVPENDQTWSMIVRYTEYTTGTDTIAGIYEDANKWFAVGCANDGGPAERIQCANGSNGNPSYKVQVSDGGILAISGNKIYWNGVEIVAPVGNYPMSAGTGVITYDVWIGAVHYSSVTGYFDGNIQALAIYDKVLSAAEIFAITARMNQLGETDRILRQDYVNQEFGALICWGMPTFNNSDGPAGDLDPNLFAPTDLDIDDWLDTCVLAGIKYASLTVKHHDGFMLWPSAQAAALHDPYTIARTAWYAANGSPDVTELFVDGCRARGIKPCLYFSISDKTHEARTGTNETTDAAAYIQMIEDQLDELLGNYGDIYALWLDGWGWDISYVNIPYATIYNYIKAIQPNCIVISNDQTLSSARSQIVEYEAHTAGEIPTGNIILAEQVETQRLDFHWFQWDTVGQDASDFMDKATILAKIAQVNGRYGTFNIGIGPDRTGHIPAAQKALLESLTT